MRTKRSYLSVAMTLPLLAFSSVSSAAATRKKPKCSLMSARCSPDGTWAIHLIHLIDDPTGATRRLGATRW